MTRAIQSARLHAGRRAVRGRPRAARRPRRDGKGRGDGEEVVASRPILPPSTQPFIRKIVNRVRIRSRVTPICSGISTARTDLGHPASSKPRGRLRSVPCAEVEAECCRRRQILCGGDGFVGSRPRVAGTGSAASGARRKVVVGAAGALRAHPSADDRRFQPVGFRLGKKIPRGGAFSHPSRHLSSEPGEILTKGFSP